MSTTADKVLQSYIQKFGQIPTQPEKLVQFSKQHIGEIPTIIYSEAKDVLTRITSSIKSGSKSPKWRVGDEVLISKDRTGLLRYIGKVPELDGDDQMIWYGLELTSGTLGQNDGMIKGKRYFKTTGKRGMFVPESKLRRRLSRKDKERRNSYAEISAHVKQLQKEYAGSDGSALFPSAEPDALLNSDEQHDGDANAMHTLVFENAEQALQYGNGSGNGNGAMQYQSASFAAEQHKPQVQAKRKKSAKKSSTVMQRTRSGSSGSSTSQSLRDGNHHQQQHHHPSTQAYSRRARYAHHHEVKEADGNNLDESDDVDGSVHDGLDDDDENESVVSELHDASGPTVKTFDTLVKYILRQKGTYREGLLDVYANPQTHALIVEAFSQMKQLQPNEQAFLWPALLKRWSKYNKN
eukprot:CAMPEP_0202687082 /NCGR_PEP_ID=MMETSP1385-20130828/2778_1 /ASSEMBLY_ACC=CAM_ASM_000861 /TAXON_ID=933848 /ORGANISM="Elphidium margaritaceum" /LENGTH=407 /DNA_ID=CAMNT_0049341801 /DNA_START=30 /DNA_END=1253 /DNA_ORIENTATION=+